MLLELWKAFLSACFLYRNYNSEAVFITQGYHLLLRTVFFHVSLHGSPANESPRKLITKSTNSTERCSWLPADSVICWFTQACYFFKCCTSVMLNGSATLLLILIRYLILISSDLLVSVQCLSCYQKSLCEAILTMKRKNMVFILFTCLLYWGICYFISSS